jgi:hypothetical protein
MDVDPEFQPILKKWGSEKGVYAFLRQQFDQINKDAFDGRLTMPDLLIKPMWLSKGLMGERNSGADYEPALSEQCYSDTNSQRSGHIPASAKYWRLLL